MVQLTGLVTLLVFLLSVGQVSPSCLRKETEIMKIYLLQIQTYLRRPDSIHQLSIVLDQSEICCTMRRLWSSWSCTANIGWVSCMIRQDWLVWNWLREYAVSDRLVLSQLFLWQRAKMQASAAGGAVEWSNCAVCVLLALLFVASPSRKCLKMSN